MTCNDYVFSAVMWRVKSLTADVVNLPGKAGEWFPDDVCLGDVPDLDSLGVLGLCFVLEEEFQCELGEQVIVPEASFHSVAKWIVSALGDDASAQWLLNSAICSEVYLKVRVEPTMSELAKNGWLLQFVGPGLRADYQIVLASVSNYGNALAFADETLCNDRRIVLAAVKSNPLAFCFAGPSLMIDLEILDFVLRTWTEYYASLKRQFASVEQSQLLLGPEREWEYATRKWFNLFRSVVEVLQRTDHLRTFFVRAVEHWADLLEFAPLDIRDDPEITLMAVRAYPDAIRFVSQRLKNDQSWQGRVAESTDLAN